MAELTIHRGSSQIGGCCTEISTEKSRILIDFGANLPGTDETAQRKDSEMFQKVFGSRRDGAVLFAHYHGDHYGLFKEVPHDVPMYIGPLARNILRVLVPCIDRDAEKKGLPVVWVPGKTNSGWARLREIGDSMKAPCGFVLSRRRNWKETDLSCWPGRTPVRRAIPVLSKYCGISFLPKTGRSSVPCGKDIWRAAAPMWKPLPG